MNYSLPIENNSIKNVSINDIVDMSDLKFPEVVTDPERIALLFIRNTGIKANFTFARCTYEEKAKYLMLFMTGNRINVTMPKLSSTWARILLHGKIESSLMSILSVNDIIRFRDDHKDLIDELYQFMVSIPLCSIDVYASVKGNSEIDIPSEFKISTYDGFNQFGLVQLFDYREMIMLSLSMPEIKPVFYQNYFQSKLCKNYPGFVGDLVNKFPYFQLLNIVTNDNEELRNTFANGLLGIYESIEINKGWD